MTNPAYAAQLDLTDVEPPRAMTEADQLSLLDRLFVWSLVLEPMIFFVLFERGVTGVTGNVSRLLQFVVIVGLIFRFTLGRAAIGKFRVINLGSPLYRYYTVYFLLSIVAGLVGIALGAYEVPRYDSIAQSAVANVLNSESIRPIFEYVVAAYYFLYFTVLPQYFLRSERTIGYFFSVFRGMFILCLVVGFIDLGAAMAHINLVPRQISSPLYLGPRFHGLAGEPRDAFVYVFLGLAILHLRAYYRGERLAKGWIAVIIAAALLTQSASGLIGTIVFLILYAIYSLKSISASQALKLFLIAVLVLTAVYETTIHTERIMAYVNSGADLWYILESGAPIPPLMQVQIINVFPLYDLTLKARHFQWLPILIGSGLGSASALNNRYTIVGFAFNNPNSQLVRTLYETGLLGFILFVKAFTHPVRYLTRKLPATKQQEFLIIALLLLGCFFGQRSAASFIYLGILLAVFRLIGERNTTARVTVPAVN